MTAITLVEKITKDFSKIKLKKTFVKVPKLKARKKNIGKAENDDKIPVSSIVNILIKNALENARKGKEKKHAAENKRYTIKDEKRDIPGGYGTASKGYGASVHASYVDYGKLFSYLGKFRTKNPYQSMNNSDSRINGDKSFALASNEIMEMGAKHIKYLRSSSREFGVGAGGIDAMSMVPMGGMNSAEWEEFKMWFLLDKVAYYLKRKTA